MISSLHMGEKREGYLQLGSVGVFCICSKSAVIAEGLLHRIIGCPSVVVVVHSVVEIEGLVLLNVGPVGLVPGVPFVASIVTIAAVCAVAPTPSARQASLQPSFFPPLRVSIPLSLGLGF